MSKLDSKKELLNTLRAGFGVVIAIILTITAGLIKMHYDNNIDILFYIGASFDVIFMLSLPILITYIIKSIKEIEEL